MRYIILLLMLAVFADMDNSFAAPARFSGYDRLTFLFVSSEMTDAEIKSCVSGFAESGINAVIIGGGRHHYIHDDLPYIGQYIETAKKIVEACHARNIKVVEHHSVVLTSLKDYAMKHKDWIQLDFSTGDASVWPEYQTWAFCPNNPEFREYYWKIAKDIMLRTGADALMSDDTVFHHGCCCKVCSQRWKDEVGGDIRKSYEASRVTGTREWRVFNEVRRRWFEDFRAWLYNRQKKELPGKPCFALLGSIASAWGTQNHGGTVEGALNTANFGVWEIYNPADFYSWRRNAAEAAALAEAARVREVVPICLPYADTAEKRDMYDIEEEVFMWALARAHDMPFLMGRVYLTGLTPKDEPRRYFTFERNHLAPYINSLPCAPIGVMFSRCSRDNDPAWESLHSAPAIAWAESLQDENVPYRAVTEETLDSGIPKNLRTLALPNVFAISDRHIERIEEFVAGGGTLIASFLPAVCDETGEPILASRQSRLERLFGVKILSLDFPANRRAEFETTSASRMKEELEAYSNKFGKGRAVYLPSLVESAAFLDWTNEGKVFKDTRDKSIIGRLVKLAADLTPSQPVRILRSEPNKHLLATVREKGTDLLIHIVNTAGADLPDGATVPTPSKVNWQPAQNLTMEFPKPPKRIKIISLDFNENREILNPGKSVTIRSPKRYELLVVKF